MLPLPDDNILQQAPTQPSAIVGVPPRSPTQTDLPHSRESAPVEAGSCPDGGTIKITAAFIASVMFTLLVALVVPYACELVFRLNDWISKIYWSTLPVKIFPDFWLFLNQGWNILIFYCFGTVFVGIVCGALPAVLTTELSRTLELKKTGKNIFFLGVPAVAYGVFGFLMWQGFIPAEQLWNRLHAVGPIRRVLIVLITALSAMVPYLVKDHDQPKRGSSGDGSAEDSGMAPPTA